MTVVLLLSTSFHLLVIAKFHFEIRGRYIWTVTLHDMLCFVSLAVFGEQNTATGGRMPGNFPGPEGLATPGPFAAGLTRNEGTIPGIGVAMPLSVPSLDSSAQGDQKPPISISIPLGAPPLPPGPHPSLLSTNQQQAYQQMPQQMSLPMPPPNMPQLQPSAHQPLLPHPHLPRPSPQIQPLNTPSRIPTSMPGSLPIPGPMGGPMVLTVLSVCVLIYENNF